MDQAKSKFNEYYNCAEKTLSKYPHLNDLETKTKVPKVYAVGGVAGILLIMIAFNCAGQFLVNALAFAFATHGSMQAIETRGHQGSTQWLSFW
ncbi:Protein yop1 [Zancudomyces culisetae]|uniref:Protein yop1 n=1 Tax=Zancudomyces culisetae TaxID=1213189 RepID=A0A1R1PHP5_ZANCU|nr:Protein yop1 [Zancudomyces culisetae]OMH80449.1 Protein yop1 [Zancudomyces culisetae]|eukprot:OMH78811.1 Protein yop1 [Zancudomyces culisetae]